MPPCAFQVFESSRELLQTMMTFAVFAASIAARRPAMPAPMTRQSVKSWFVVMVLMLTR